jgi:hypothetical protein
LGDAIVVEFYSRTLAFDFVITGTKKGRKVEIKAEIQGGICF